LASVTVSPSVHLPWDVSHHFCKARR
jgi:hypothetical protein